ncbi:ankyrin repeat-containing domain protein [Xylariaceae sp. FL0255]|nr:ankyrin repeat-containing domain protein [Xylariaceae sp. FL0255]
MIGGPGEPNEETALLIEAANHQYLQIIEVFKAPTVMDRLNVHWGQVLSAVIRAQNRGLTSMILSMNPDLFEEPHSIDFPLPIGPIKAEEWGLHKTSVNRRHGNRRNRVRRQIEIKRFKFKQTTTYAEAIRATHNEVVDQIERSSDYQSALSVGQALQCAIDASAAVGNRQMLCKLLRIEPTGIGLDLKKTMTHAILNGHDEEFWLLFQKGANLNPTRQRTSAGRRLSHYPHPLLAALLKQNEHIFFGLLAAGPFRLTDDLCYLSYEPYNHEKTCLLDQAILWGNEKIIHALPTFLSTCVREPKSPSFAGVQCSFSDRVIEALRANDGRVLDLLVMKKLFGTKSLTSLFYLVTPLDDVVFLRRLIAHGADPFPQLGEAFRKMQYRDEIWDRIRHIFKPPWLDLFWVLLDLARESPHASHVGTLILRRALLLGEVGLQHTQRLLELDSVHHPGRSMPLPWSISVKWLMKSKTHFGLFRKLADRGFLQDKAEHCLSIAIALRDQELILFVLKHPNITHRLSPWHVGSPLRLAAETGSIEITKLLLAHGAVVDQDGNHGLVILESAIKSRNLELVRYIVGLGVSVNGLMVHHRDFDSPDSFRQHIDGIISPLQVAIITGTPDIIEFLLANGADINEEPFHASRTPLQQAVQLNRPGIVELLMAKGANVNGKAAYNSGATAFQLAVINGNCEIAAFLIKHGADIHAEPAKVNGRRPLEGAAENGRIYMIDFLYQNEYRFEQAECLRAIELAGRNGHWGCVDRISEFMRSTTELENQIDVVFTRYSALERAGKLLGGLELG